MFQQCPAGYCCSGSTSNTCSVYNYCPGNRTGTLCGACQEGFSVSILTGTCTPDNKCGGDQWFWLVAILTAMAYALWYTLKDDIFAFFFSLISLMMQIFNRSKSKVNDNPVRVMPSNKVDPSLPSFRVADDLSSIGRPNDSVNVDTLEKENTQDDVDKGYFGIVTYYVQMAAVIMIQIEFNEVGTSQSFLDKLVSYIGRFLNLELTQMSFDVCPIIGLTTVGKYVYNLMFLFGIYLSWLGFFVFTFILAGILMKSENYTPMARRTKSFKLKLVRGVIEIIKYTFAGFCGIIFLSLVCVQIGESYVWFHDGTNVCLEKWQIIIVIFALFYALPFPSILFLGLKMLKQNKISPTIFVFSCLFPLPALVFMLIHTCVRKGIRVKETPALSEESQAIISVLQGPYREDDKHFTLYWEAMVSIRRLLITAMTLVSFASIRMVIITTLCLIFLVQHYYLSPFLVRSSNDVETLSLLLLSLASIFNLLKASLTDSGAVPSGPTVSFFKSIELCEKVFVLIIIAYILLVEIKSRKANKGKPQGESKCSKCKQCSCQEIGGEPQPK